MPIAHSAVSYKPRWWLLRLPVFGALPSISLRHSYKSVFALCSSPPHLTSSQALEIAYRWFWARYVHRSNKLTIVSELPSLRRTAIIPICPCNGRAYNFLGP